MDDLANTPGTPQPAVFFDLDRTIIEGSSISGFGIAAWRAGLIDLKGMRGELLRGMLFALIGETEGVADEALPKILATIKGKKQSDLMELRGPLVDRMLEEARPETLRLLELHGKMGRDTYVVSASAIEIVELLAERLGFTGAIATEAEVRDGIYTGELSQPFRHGGEKAKAIAELAAERNYDLSLSFAYGDSHNDLPMLELVGIPIAINPDTKLADVAYERGWPVVQFAKPFHASARRVKIGGLLAVGFAAGWIARRRT